LHLYGKDGVAPTGGSMKEYLLSLLDADQRDTVQFYDHVSREELQHALSSAWLSVFPSYAEAFAIAPMEAMLCGCPTIYSQRGSGPELMQDGRDGLLIDPDNTDQLAEAIVRLLEDDQLARRLGEAGRQRVKDRFTVGRAVTANEVFYRDTIDAFKAERSAIRVSSKPLAESRA
jgi:glycosyltransferase involved in cell wall biosynthesis